ncbi:hypothetical protein EKN07_05620 [Actinobaculum sp. 352]|nr:hypothetical protein EKN07_05620 [Actinobaculum sp. 352]
MHRRLTATSAPRKYRKALREVAKLHRMWPSVLCETGLVKRNALSQIDLASRPERQYLGSPAPDIATVLDNLVCFQAQIGRAAHASWKLRTTNGSTDLIRTWSIRGTLQLATRSDARVLTLLSRERNEAETRRVLENHGLTGRQLEKLIDFLLEELHDGSPHSRDQLYEVTATRFGSETASTAHTPWGGVMKLIACRYVLEVVSNDSRGTLFRIDSPLPDTRVPDVVEAHGSLLWERFLTGYGPALPRDFQRWLGIRAADLKPLKLDADVPNTTPIPLRPDDVQSVPRSASATSGHKVASSGDLSPIVLPEFDPYIVTTASRSSLFSSPSIAKGVVRPGGWLASSILLGHQIVGYKEKGTPASFVVDAKHAAAVQEKLAPAGIQVKAS